MWDLFCLTGIFLALATVLPAVGCLFPSLVSIFLQWGSQVVDNSWLGENLSFGIVGPQDDVSFPNGQQENDHLRGDHGDGPMTKEIDSSTNHLYMTAGFERVGTVGEWQNFQNTTIFPADKEREDTTFRIIPRQRRVALVSQTSRPYIPAQPQSTRLHTHARSQSAEVKSPHARHIPAARRGATFPAASPGLASFWPTNFTTRLRPLETTLYEGSRSLQTKVLSFLVIGCGYEDAEQPIKGLERDINYLRDAFDDSDSVVLEFTPRKDATLAKIHDKIVSCWNRASPGTHLLLLLTGHGIDNAMELSDEERIDESYVSGIFEGLPRKDVNVTVVFDICRLVPNKMAARINKSVALAWSCSPGQKAGSLVFESHMLSSFFLIAVFMASCDRSRDPNTTFEHHLRTRISQLAKFGGYLDHRKGCANCLSQQPCPNAFEARDEFMQDIDLEQAPDALNELYPLLMQHPRFAKLSESVRSFVMNNRLFLKSNGLPLHETPSRGASGAVSQAPTLSMVECAS